jgi:hypothetical protein
LNKIQKILVVSWNILTSIFLDFSIMITNQMILLLYKEINGKNK